jgi:hypothetical protein
MTRVEATGEKVRLRSTIFAIEGRHEERFRRRAKTLAAKDWQTKTYCAHEKVEREVKWLAAERAMMLRG